MKRQATVKFFSQEEGGRRLPPLSGYRPHLKLGEEKTSCVITLVGADETEKIMDFGIEHTVFIELIFEKTHGDKLYKGMDMLFYEGERLVGAGKLL